MQGKRTDREWEYFGAKVFVVLAIRYHIVDRDPTDDAPSSANGNKVDKLSAFAVLSERYPSFLKIVADEISTKFFEDKVNEVRCELTLHPGQFHGRRAHRCCPMR